MRGWKVGKWILAAALTAALGLAATLPSWAADKAEADAAVARTRKQVQVLDDLYKGVVVMITENYVDDDADLAAGAAFQKVFEGMKKHHEVRLLDATGDPYDDKNVAKDEFEKAAIAALKAGKATHEEVVEKDGKRQLRMATPIPVVLEKCKLCHPAYERAKAGEAIGALSYTIAIE